jgi:hypothetical protein
MAKISETSSKVKQGLVSNGQEVKLNDTNVFHFLKALVDKGYRLSKTLTIKDGSLLFRYFEILSGTAVGTETDPTFPQIYQNILNAISKANEDGAYETNDAAVIDKLLVYINEHMAEKFGLETASETETVEL